MKFFLFFLTLCSINAQNFYLAGTECAASTTPKCGGFIVIAIPIGASTYSWTKDFESVPRAGKFAAIDTTTGICKDMWDKSFKPFTISVLGCGAAGVATTQAATTLALDAGGGLLFSGISKRFSWLRMWLGAIDSKASNTTQVNVMLSFGGKF